MICPTLAAGLHPIDWTILVAYVLGMLVLGYYYSRKQESTKEYFVGTGTMSSFLIGISMFATLLSTLSYLSFPGEIVSKGPTILAGAFLSIPVAYVVVAYVLLPVYMKQRVTSAYELLESRLGVGARLLGATMFLVLRLVWMSVMIYLTTDVLLTIMRLPQSATPYVACTFGFIAIIYTSMGGLRAVVITDLVQFFLLLLGAILTVAFITWDMGGFAWFPTQWASNWDHQPVVPVNIYTRVTVVGAFVSQALWRIATAGGDQTAVQRFMSTKDVVAARKSYFVYTCAGFVVLAMLALVGFALLGYYTAHADLIPGGATIDDAADQLFPHFIAHQLPPGLSGLVIAAMFAAAMSSVDSGVNSITAVVTVDFLDRFGKGFKTEKAHLLFTKILAFSIGAVVVLGSSLFDLQRWSFMDLIKRTVNVMVTPLFALFILAIFVPFATGAGALIGALYGLSSAVIFAYWGPITGGPDPSFQWIGTIAIVVDLFVACLVSKIVPNSCSASRRTSVCVAAVVLLVVLCWCTILWGRTAAAA